MSQAGSALPANRPMRPTATGLTLRPTVKAGQGYSEQGGPLWIGRRCWLSTNATRCKSPPVRSRHLIPSRSWSRSSAGRCCRRVRTGTLWLQEHDGLARGRHAGLGRVIRIVQPDRYDLADARHRYTQARRALDPRKAGQIEGSQASQTGPGQHGESMSPTCPDKSRIEPSAASSPAFSRPEGP